MWMSLLVLPFEPLVQIPSLCLATEKVNRSVLDGDLSCAPALSSFNTKWIKRRVNEKQRRKWISQRKNATQECAPFPKHSACPSDK